jgi:hypothetical protein
MHRIRTAAVLVAALALPACGVVQGARPTPAPSASLAPSATPAQPATAAAQAEPAPYHPPSKPCDAVPPATRREHDLTEPDETVYPNTIQDPDTGDEVTIDILTCSLWAENPARGPEGRPNHLFFYVYIQVPTAEQASDPAGLAHTLFDGERENLGGGRDRRLTHQGQHPPRLTAPA